MIVSQIDRLPVIVRPGFDCRRDNANCPGCTWLRENHKPTADHGISGGIVLYGVATDTTDGRRFALTLEVLAHDYPPSAREGVAAARRRHADDPTVLMREWFTAPRGAGFYLHDLLDPGAPIPTGEGFINVTDKCPCFDDGPCRCETLTWIGADDFYRQRGFQGDATIEELKTNQSEDFWIALGGKIVAWMEDR